MNAPLDHLSQPLSLRRGPVLRNRLAKSATSEALADRRTGRPTEALVRLYERWGRGGAGLLITGNVVFDLQGRTEPGNVVIHDDRDLPVLRRWAEAAQQHGAQLWMQINHAGRQAPRGVTRQPAAPSAVAVQGLGGLFATPRELDDDTIRRLIDGYARTAAVAVRAGFSGVQIHAAHGYLISQFLSPLTNRRTDRWGGDIEGRMRFLVEVVGAVRRAVGGEVPIGVKLNSADFQRGGFSEDESMAVVAALEAEGIDLLEISGGSYESSAMMGDAHHRRASTRAREAYFLDYAEQVRRRTRLPLMLTGGMRTAAAMADVIASGAIDVVGMARPLVVEPDLPAQLARGAAAAALAITPRVGVRMFDDMLQIVWYQRQLRRMSRGLEPARDLGRWSSLVVGFARNYAYNPLAWLWRRDRRPRLSTAAEPSP